MFARVTLLEIDTVRIDIASAVRMYEAEVLPEMRTFPGYGGVYVLTSPEGKAMIVSLWETEEAAEASAAQGWYAETLARYVTIFRSPPGRDRYEVVLADAPSMAPG